VRVADDVSRWLTAERDAGLSEDQRTASETQLRAIRDRVLNGAQISPGDYVVDLGAGTGLLTSGALPMVGPDGTVMALDQSGDVLDRIEPPASGAGTLERVRANATALPFPDGSVDAIVTRSVLIYISDLQRAFAEMARVLRPGGRLSIFEPVNARRRHDANLQLPPADLHRIDMAFRQATPAARSMFGFDELSVSRYAKHNGFRDVAYQSEAIRSTLTGRNEMHNHLHRPPHPGAASPVETLASIDPELADRYARAWGQAIDRQSTITYTTPVIYLTATRSAL